MLLGSQPTCFHFTGFEKAILKTSQGAHGPMAFLGRTLHSANMLQYRDEHRGSRETWTEAIGRMPGRWHYLDTITKSTKVLLVEKRETRSIFLSPHPQCPQGWQGRDTTGAHLRTRPGLEGGLTCRCKAGQAGDFGQGRTECSLI